MTEERAIPLRQSLYVVYLVCLQQSWTDMDGNYQYSSDPRFNLAGHARGLMGRYVLLATMAYPKTLIRVSRGLLWRRAQSVSFQHKGLSWPREASPENDRRTDTTVILLKELARPLGLEDQLSQLQQESCAHPIHVRPCLPRFRPHDIWLDKWRLSVRGRALLCGRTCAL